MAYKYNADTHNSIDPEIIVPILIDFFNPVSVVDIGCGTGNFLSEFKKLGVKSVLGVDGDTNSNNLRIKNIVADEFQLEDLNQQFHLGRKFDIALCLEVGEHLNEKSAEILISTLVNCSDVIIFSAAIPLQGGQYHLNEQWQTYWNNKFSQFQYQPIDLIRPIIWDNEKVSYWYRQNIIVYILKSSKYNYLLESGDIKIWDLVHPINYLNHANYLQNILGGKSPLKLYIYLLYKYIKNLFIKSNE